MAEARRRTTLFRILLTLSFVGGSWNMFTGLSNAFSEPNIERQEQLIEYFEGIEVEPGTEFLVEELKTFIHNITMNVANYGVFEFMFNSISLIGVFLMFQFRRVGFWVYCIAQLLLLMNPILFGGYSLLSVTLTFTYSFITMIFIALYSTQLKYMDA